jgi:diphthamide biosynthesis methyltransferase
MAPRTFSLNASLTRFQESYYGRSITIADREMVESNSDEILRDADKEDVAFLVVGDPFGYVEF